MADCVVSSCVMNTKRDFFRVFLTCEEDAARVKSDKKCQISAQSNDDDVKALKEIVEELGGWPMQEGSTWNDTKWSFDKVITNVRQTLGHRTDKIFDIASFITNLENANNVSLS